MRINDMVLMQQFNKNEKSSSKANSGSLTLGGNASIKSPKNYPPPNWDKIMTKREPTMSDEEFKQAIKKQVEIDAANGIYASNDEYNQLYRDYVSVVSPDRKAAFEANPNPGSKKLSDIIGNQSGVLSGIEGTDMVYSPGSNMWMTFQTSAEKERGEEFRQLYQEAYKEYERINGKVDRGPAGVKTFIMYG